MTGLDYYSGNTQGLTGHTFTLTLPSTMLRKILPLEPVDLSQQPKIIPPDIAGWNVPISMASRPPVSQSTCGSEILSLIHI